MLLSLLYLALIETFWCTVAQPFAILVMGKALFSWIGILLKRTGVFQPHYVCVDDFC